MTDKQIIIDNVNVSGCKFYKGYCRIASLCDYSGHLCEVTSNCHYKNWKRKEQECERLKEGYSELTDIVSPYMDDFTGYNEELGGFDIVLCVKELMEQFKAKEQECEELKREIDIRSCANIELSLEFKKYKKAIDEIEEIADNNYENPEMERIFKIIGGLDV